MILRHDSKKIVRYPADEREAIAHLSPFALFNAGLPFRRFANDRNKDLVQRNSR
jgi:hypothetical protein